jgi:hypothetical protein
MKRVGYDERTERYTFRQGDELWLGEPGSLYGGKMKWAGKAPDASPPSDEDYDTDSSGLSQDDSASLVSLPWLILKPLYRSLQGSCERYPQRRVYETVVLARVQERVGCTSRLYL